MRDRLPPRKKVAVSVEPSPADLARQIDLGFDFFQIHFNPQTPCDVIKSWANRVDATRLWLAPRLPPEMDIYPELLPLADTFLMDTFHPEKMGGTGVVGDWAKFKRYREAHPAKLWILSGGLNDGNIAEAVTATGAKFVDVLSGVEQAPGIKSPAKLQAFVLALHNATKQGNPRH
jgi:phosphoribosylanthranilate isomerase